MLDHVAPSGLFTIEQLSAAFQDQAIEAERSQKFNYSRTSSRIEWESSKDALFTSSSKAHCVELLSGVKLVPGFHYTWTLQVEEVCCLTWVGVASGPVAKDEWLGKQPGGWVYGSNGSVNHATGVDNGPYNHAAAEYGKGSVLHMELDLTRQGVGGSMIVNGVTIFTGMHSADGFVPALSLRAPGSVRLLDFQL